MSRVVSILECLLWIFRWRVRLIRPLPEQKADDLFKRSISIVGPRTVQHGTKFTMFLSAVDYNSGEVEISLEGNKNGEEINIVVIKLENLQKNVTIDVSFFCCCNILSFCF